MSEKRTTCCFFIAIGILAIFVIAGMIYLFATANEQAKITEALRNAQHTGLQTELLPAGIQVPSALTKEGKDVFLSDYMEQVEQNYAADSQAISAFRVSKESLLNSESEEIDCAIAEGLLNTKTHYILVWGNTAKVQITITAWIKYIKEEEKAFEIYISVSKNRITAEMVKEDGKWKVLRYIEYHRLDGSSLGQVGFTCYEDAYDAAIEMEIINPF